MTQSFTIPIAFLVDFAGLAVHIQIFKYNSCFFSVGQSRTYDFGVFIPGTVVEKMRRSMRVPMMPRIALRRERARAVLQRWNTITAQNHNKLLFSKTKQNNYYKVCTSYYYYTTYYSLDFVFRPLPVLYIPTNNHYSIIVSFTFGDNYFRPKDNVGTLFSFFEHHCSCCI